MYDDINEGKKEKRKGGQKFHISYNNMYRKEPGMEPGAEN